MLPSPLSQSPSVAQAGPKRRITTNVVTANKRLCHSTLYRDTNAWLPAALLICQVSTQNHLRGSPLSGRRSFARVNHALPRLEVIFILISYFTSFCGMQTDHVGIRTLLIKAP